MKKMMITALAVFTGINVMAQAEIGKANFGKETESAVKNIFAYSQQAVENAVENRMGKIAKAKKAKNFLMYRNVNIAEISDKTVTLYIGVEKLSKKDNHTEFTLLIANEFDRFYTASENAELFDKAKNFVNGFA